MKTQPTIDVATVMATPRPAPPETITRPKYKNVETPEGYDYVEDGTETVEVWDTYRGPVTGDYVLVSRELPGSFKPETGNRRSTREYVWVIHTLSLSPTGKFVTIDDFPGKPRYLLPHMRHKWDVKSGKGGRAPEAVVQLGNRVGYNGPAAHSKELAFPWETGVIGTRAVITLEEYRALEAAEAQKKANAKQAELDKGYVVRLHEALAKGDGNFLRTPARRLLNDYPDEATPTVKAVVALLDAALDDRRDLIRKLDDIRQSAGRPYGIEGSYSEVEKRVAEYKAEEASDG